MHLDLMSLIIAIGIAGACILLVSLGIGSVLVAWAVYATMGLPAAVTAVCFYLAFAPCPVPWCWPWKKPC